MDSSQHYQPLSHALNPALAGAQSRSPYSTSSVYTPPPQPASIPAVRQPQSMQDDLQEDEDQEDDDEGIVEGQLNSHDRREAPPASPPRTSLCVSVSLHVAAANWSVTVSTTAMNLQFRSSKTQVILRRRGVPVDRAVLRIESPEHLLAQSRQQQNKPRDLAHPHTPISPPRTNSTTSSNGEY